MRVKNGCLGLDQVVLAGFEVGEQPAKLFLLDLHEGHAPVGEKAAWLRRLVQRLHLMVAWILPNAGVEPIDLRSGSFQELHKVPRAVAQQPRNIMCLVVCPRCFK